VWYYHTSLLMDGNFFGISDAFVDYTRARVELSDSPTWAAARHQEIQIPLEWADGRIVVKSKPRDVQRGPADVSLRGRRGRGGESEGLCNHGRRLRVAPRRRDLKGPIFGVRFSLAASVSVCRAEP
jgi:hypothetical protein